MNAIEKRARELLGQQVGQLKVGGAVNARGDLFVAEPAAVKALIAALTPPEGYLLVPVEPTEKMQRAGAGITCTNVDEAWEVWHAMIAARPEVKP